MKFVKFIPFFIVLLFFSCTVEKTPFGNRLNFRARGIQEEATHINNNNHLISIEASDGEFLRGYNELSVKIVTANTFERLNVQRVELLVTRTDENGRLTSAPHSRELSNEDDNLIFKGFAVFDTPKNYSVLNGTHSGIKTNWHIYLNYVIDNITYKAEKEIEVLDTRNPNLNMTQFVGNDGKQYYIALIAPELPKVAINNLIAGIWVQEETSSLPELINGKPNPNKFIYSVANNYILELDPRMPGEDMGNHSSPNNEHLTQKEDGFYHGRVNYTMTGYWTLNFILKNHLRNVIKGTEVSRRVQMGVFGEQSELHIDILF